MFLLKKDSHGFTLIELLGVLIVLVIISLITLPTINDSIEKSQKSSLKISASSLIDAGKEYSVNHYDDLQENGSKTFSITNGKFDDTKLSTKGTLPQIGSINVDSNGNVIIAIYDGKYCATKNREDLEIIVSEVTSEECLSNIETAISYNDFEVTKGVNVPALTPGLTPVYWNGSEWTPTTSDDPNWYNYNTTDKQWANAVSNDGSMWVWIPRYAYQINNSYHTNSGTGGVINIKFLMGNSNDVPTPDTTVIELTPTYSGSSQTNYVLHPAFKFGNRQLTGIWIAKFEATAIEGISNLTTACTTQDDNVTTKIIKIIPGVTAWRCISVSNAFTNSYNMQADTDTYGWNNTNVDTHLMKNSEWGAVAYLSQSNYGKGTANIWLNPNSNYTTGCAGTAAGQSQTTDCNSYLTANGLNASTTLNIYGVYDMSGGSAEMTASYINNLTVGGGTYINGQALMEANSKYRDSYPLATTDTASNNYLETNKVFGDGIWETSIPDGTNNAWYIDITEMPNTTSSWFVRGGHNRNFNGAGLYGFASSGGGGSIDFGFRPVLLVGNNI